jgi:sugar/nucleoside kinase (ribokinase family)
MQLAPNPLHVVAIGNAIVDVLAFADDAFVEKQNIRKGTMLLIDEARAEALYNDMASTTEVSGGSAANTLAGMANLGAKTAFIGKVFDDELGKIFRHDLRAVGVDFHTLPATEGKATARCLILVTPDGQRTMNTFIGACNELYESDVDEALIKQGQILYGEGYMWDQDCAKEALRKAFRIAKENGIKVAFTLSDLFCVERHGDAFNQLIDDSFDILFGNETEIRALYPGKDFPAILDNLQGRCEIVAITLGDQGSLIMTPEKRIHVDAVPVRDVVDTTGAGDLYAAGFMYGLTHGKSLKECGKLGSACASHIITHLGARAQKPLKQVVAA